MWPFKKKPDPVKVKAALDDEQGLKDELIYTDDELEKVILDGLSTGFFDNSPHFQYYIQNHEDRPVSRPYVENEIRKQHPNDRRFWSLTLNPFLEEN